MCILEVDFSNNTRECHPKWIHNIQVAHSQVSLLIHEFFKITKGCLPKVHCLVCRVVAGLRGFLLQ